MYNEKDKKMVFEMISDGLPIKLIFSKLINSTYGEMLQYIDDLKIEGKITEEEIKAKRKEYEHKKKEKKGRTKSLVGDFKEKAKSEKLILDDVELFSRMILENKSFINVNNVKLGIYGFIKVGRFGQARRFYENCMQRVGKNSSKGKELSLLDESLRKLENQRRAHLLLKSGRYSAEDIFRKTGILLADTSKNNIGQDTTQECRD